MGAAVVGAAVMVGEAAVTDLEGEVEDTLLLGGGGHAFGGFTGRPGFSGTREFSTGRFSGRGDHGRFGDRGFRGRDRDFRDRRFRDFDGDSFDFGFYGFGYPDYYPYNYPYDYAYPYYNYDPYQGVDNSGDYRTSRSGDVISAVQSALMKRGYYRDRLMASSALAAGARSGPSKLIKDYP